MLISLITVLVKHGSPTLGVRLTELCNLGDEMRTIDVDAREHGLNFILDIIRIAHDWETLEEIVSL